MLSSPNISSSNNPYHTTQYNIHESPAVYLKEAFREIRSRLKLCELYSFFLDDIANIEDMYGKLIVKIGSSQKLVKDDWPMEMNHLLEQVHTSTEKVGKQHIGYSLCVSQSISREFSEYAKSNSRKIHDLELKMQNSVEEIAKNSKSWKKMYGKYIRLIQDAEGSIIARDAAIREYAEKINNIPNEEGFFNRSITMVLGKASQNDATKKQHDKCRALVHELDLIESDLSHLTSVLRQQQENFNSSLASTLQEIETMEEERLNFIKTGLSRFHQANTGMSEHLTQIFDHLKGLISELDIHVDIEAFERELEFAKLTFKEPPGHSGALATERKSGEILPVSASDHLGAINSPYAIQSEISQSLTIDHPRTDDDESIRHLRSNLMIFDKLKDGIECIKKLAQRATGTFADISDAEKHYSKTAMKVLEKHGYSSSGTTSAMISSSFASTDPKLRDLVNQYESSFCHSGWDNITQLTEKLSEAHLTVSEVLLDKCCVITDNAQRKMDSLVKEGSEKVHHVNKKIEGARATQMRLKSKLNRVQKELKDRRMVANSPRKPKEELQETSPIVLPNETIDVNTEVLNESTQKPCDANDQVLAPPPSSTVGKPKSDKGMIQGWESFGNAFGAVAVTALGAAGVLESSTERNNNRIANLEEEEAACIESLGTAATSTQVVTDLCVNDLSAIIMSLKQGLSKEMENFKTSLLLFIDGHTVGLNISINVLARLKYVTDAIDIQQDIHHFHSNIIVASLANEERKVPNLFFLAPVEEFVKLKNDLVDLERQNEKEYQVVGDPNVISSPGSIERKSLLTTPLRQRSRGNSSCDESMMTSTSESVPIDDHVSESGEIIRALENFPSEDIETKISNEDSRGHLKDAVTPIPSTRSRSDSTLSDSSPAPIIAPSECSVPDYDEETIRDLKASQSKEPKVEIARTPEKNLPSSLKSQEIGTFVGSSEEGLRRSVTTERHNHNEMPHEDRESVARPLVMPPREETWTSPELAKFDLPPTEKVLEYFSCALYPKKGLLTHGRLFITNRYLAFSGWPETRVIIELQHIENVEKKQVFFIPNALSVNSQGEEYFFGSFLDRDLCYRMLTSMVMIAKSLNEITNDSSDNISGKHRKNSFRIQISDSPKDMTENNEQHASNSEPEEFDDGVDYDLSQLPDYLNLFVASSVSCVYETSTPLAASLIWRICWQEKGHFTDFLSSVGDFDISATDWIPFTSSLSKSQDPLNLKFQYKRTVDYLHPRTSMLMFGPKNATARQIQYLYLPELASHPTENISSVRQVRSGCILCATQFEGIPMSDVFEVLQYWTFQKLSLEKTVIRIGVTVNFLKGTLVKGQILSGTKEELTVLSKQWCDYSIQAIEKYLQQRQTEASDLLDDSSHSTATRRKSVTKFQEDHQVASTTAPVVPLPNREGNARMERYLLFCCVLLGVVLLIQTLYLYLMYRRVGYLDQHLSDLKSLLNSTLSTSIIQSKSTVNSCNVE